MLLVVPLLVARPSWASWWLIIGTWPWSPMMVVNHCPPCPLLPMPIISNCRHPCPLLLVPVVVVAAHSQLIPKSSLVGRCWRLRHHGPLLIGVFSCCTCRVKKRERGVSNQQPINNQTLNLHERERVRESERESG